MSSISLTSRVLDVLGRTLIGSPASLKMPEDFYLLPGDRSLLTSTEIEQQQNITARIGVDHFRRLLLTRVAMASTVVALLVCGLLLAARSFFH